jgi:non-ribosomal peptide synthetase component E (peptide arylation enzyme)
MTASRTSPWLHPADAGERHRRLGVWGELTLAEMFDEAASRNPDKTAVIDSRGRTSYRQLRELTLRCATVLDGLGVRPGDPVAVQLPGCALLPALHLACVRVGALFMPLSPTWRAGELRPLLGRVTPPVFVTTAADPGFDHVGLGETLRTELPGLRHVLPALSDDPGGIEYLAATAEPMAAAELATRRLGPDAPAHTMCSSGTTGIPKASVCSSNDMIALTVRHLGPNLRLSPDDVAAGIAPAGTGSTGYLFPILSPLLVGATAAVLEHWSPQEALDLIVRERATYATAIPTQMVMLLGLALEDADLSVFTRFNNAGAPLPERVARELERRMGCRVQTIYGATDGGVPVMTSVNDPDDKRWTTVGAVCPGVELQLLDADGTPAPDGRPGEVCWRGPSKSYGYLRQPDYDRAAFDDEGFFHSGDLGELDAEGYLRIVGRTKDMILRGGTNIFPAEIEQLLGRHPHVADVAVVGIPDERLGERACAVVVAVPGATPELAELCRHLRDHNLATVKLPERLVVVDSLPVNAGGKVDKNALREQVSKELTHRPT